MRRELIQIHSFASEPRPAPLNPSLSYSIGLRAGLSSITGQTISSTWTGSEVEGLLGFRVPYFNTFFLMEPL